MINIVFEIEVNMVILYKRVASIIKVNDLVIIVNNKVVIIMVIIILQMVVNYYNIDSVLHFVILILKD